MNFCKQTDCTLPPFRDGFDASMCVGHQPVSAGAVMEHPLKPGEALRVMDPVVEELACWGECERTNPPVGMCLVDSTLMAGELWCADCIRTTKVPISIRLDDEGNNY